MGLLDWLGRKVEPQKLKARAEEATPTTTAVRSPISEHPAQGLTPSKLAGLLREAEEGDPTAWLEVAEEIEEKDPHYRAVIATRKYQVASLEVKVEAASDEKKDIEAADLIRSWLNRDTLQQELVDILDALGKGYSVSEIIWDLSGKLWLPQELKWRDPRWFTFDKDRETLLLRGDDGPQPLTPYKYIIHQHRSKSGLMVRGGLARPLVWLYLFKNYDLKSWVQFLEGYGKPLRVGKYGPGATEEDRKTLLRAVRSIVADAGAIIPADMALEFVEAKITANVDMFERMADWCDRQTSKVVLGQTGTTDTGQYVGTADAHEAVRNDIERADAVQLAATLNRDLIRPIVHLNFGDQVGMPRLSLVRPDREDVKALVENITKLVPLGLQVERSWIADKLGIPDPDQGAELLTAPAAAPPMGEVSLNRQSSLVATPDALPSALTTPLAAMVDDIRAMIADAETLEEALSRLDQLLLQPPSPELEQALAVAFTSSGVAGARGMEGRPAPTKIEGALHDTRR